MLRLDDFFHLPQLDEWLERLVAGQDGLVLIAGRDAHAPTGAGPSGLLPSGRTAVFRALAGELLAGAPRAVLVAEGRDALRARRRPQLLQVRPPQTYAQQIEAAAARQPDLLIVDRIDAASAAAAFAAARGGPRVVAQLDTIGRGAELARELRQLGVPLEQLGLLRWVVAVERLATLCSNCASPQAPAAEVAERLAELLSRFGLALDPAEADGWGCLAAPGCEQCGFTGRQGDVAVFDVYEARAPRAAGLARELYLWGLIERGLLAPDDLLEHDGDRLRQTYRMLAHSAQALEEARAGLRSKHAELEAANQVLEQRTAALRSLQAIGQALTRSTDLPGLAAQVCRQAGELCGADRVLLYLSRQGGMAEVLAAHGWESRLLNQLVDLAPLELGGGGARPFAGWPPGTVYQHADAAGYSLRAGLCAPLAAEGQLVGAMVIQSTRKNRFAPAELALAQAFADQAALAIQRAALIDARLRQERLERELDLAREVQQSVLPRVFPLAAGYSFAACNQPARSVGGDMYDVFWAGPGQIGLVIADVSGKGMPAALYMALTRSLLLAEARRERSPRAVLLSVNQLLRELGDPHMFVTVFYGLLEAASGRLTYARAGHDYPLLLRDGVAAPLGGQGIVLGCFDSDEITLSEEQIVLRSGDRLALYTDGLTDVFGSGGERFGPERLAELFCAHAGRGPAELCDESFAALAAYQGEAEQFDDMTLLVVGVGG